jgi:hypothetical protein
MACRIGIGVPTQAFRGHEAGAQASGRARRRVVTEKAVLEFFAERAQPVACAVSAFSALDVLTVARMMLSCGEGDWNSRRPDGVEEHLQYAQP